MNPMRRKPGALLPLEIEICECAVELQSEGLTEVHGYELAKRLAAAGRKSLTAYGTLYRALGRLEQMGLMTSRWEDPQLAAQESRPVRRLYTLTPAADHAIREANRTALTAHAKRQRRGWAPA
jgi:PadR family transcriptional regulator, regulatory protein PadR